jgi:hypothetical protein
MFRKARSDPREFWTSGGEAAGFLSPFAGPLFANISMLSNG